MKTALLSRPSAAALLFLSFSLCTRGARAAEHRVGAGEAFAKIQEGIDAAADNDSVLVKAGSYAEAVDFKGKKIRVASIDGPASTTIDATGIAKSAVVAFKTAETDQSILEGFTLTGGTGAPLNMQGTLLGGGGVFIDKATPVVKGCVITKNAAAKGGGILIQGIGSGGLIEACEVTENTAKVAAGPAGGGLAYVSAGTGSDVLTIKDSRFSKNTVAVAGAAQGGGAYLGGQAKAKVVVTGCTFSENLIGIKNGAAVNTTGEGGGLFLDNVIVELDGGEVSLNQCLRGGGVALRNQGVASFLRNLKVKGNMALAAGGGGGFISPAGSTTRLTLTNVEISENAAGTLGGGGILIEAGAPSLESCKLIGNTSTDDGAGMRAASSGIKSKVNATSFIGNKAGGQGGAVYVSSAAASTVVYTNCLFVRNTAMAGGGAIYNKAPSAAAIVKFFYCVFHENTTTTGTGGIQFDPVTASGLISNSILWGNKPADYPATGQQTKISYSDVESPSTFPPSTKGMLSVDPGFVNPTAEGSDYHLRPDSPLVDKGLVGTDVDGKIVDKDFDGKPRATDGDGNGSPDPDLGLYESDEKPGGAPKFVRGDANDDGAADVSDPVVVIAYQFLAGPAPLCFDAVDADDTGVIDLSDPIFILAYLFQAGPAPPPPAGACGTDPTEDELDPCSTTSC